MKQEKSEALEFLAFSKNLKNVFRIYDVDNSGYLDRTECRELIDDLRISLYLPKADNKIFEKIFGIIDVDNDGEITLMEMEEQLALIYPILQEVGTQLKDQIECEFNEFDFDDTGHLGRYQIEMLFNKIAVRLKLGQLEPWQIDYLVSLIDENSDGDLDIDEVIANYRIIVKEIYKFHKDEKQCDATSINPFDGEIDPGIKNKALRQKARFFKKIGSVISKADENQKTGGSKYQSKNSMIDMINKEVKANSNQFRAVTDLINPKTKAIQTFKKNELDESMSRRAYSNKSDTYSRMKTLTENKFDNNNFNQIYPSKDTDLETIGDIAYNSPKSSDIENSISVDELENDKKMKAFRSSTQNFSEAVINKDKEISSQQNSPGKIY